MCIFAFLFGVKIVWNITLTAALAWKEFRPTPYNRSGISIMPYVEFALLVVLVLLSAISSGSAWFNHPMQVASWGSMAIVGSYILSVVLGLPFGLLLSLIKKWHKK